MYSAEMNTWIKYPRTFHLPWSEGITNDDKVMKDTSWFEGKEVAVTVKMDGENTSMYQDNFHARSIDGATHKSRTWAINFWSHFRYQIPEGWRICGENLYARHSIEYDNLPSYFMGFSIWNEQNICLSWPKTVSWFEALGIQPVTTLYVGTYNEDLIRYIGDGEMRLGAEGYVIRPVDCFNYDDFNKKVGKVVRTNHVQTDDHWMHQEVVPNKLEKK